MNAFEDALDEDPYDATTRLVYADWLEEHGRDDEAAFQRAWTPEWQRADDRLREFARVARSTLEEVKEAVEDYIATGRTAMLGDWWGQGFGATEQFGSTITLDEFWSTWEAWTRTSVDGPCRVNEPFRCCP